jgi:hypothetical protein
VRRILPALGLFFLAPLVAEFLLGDFPITMIGILIVLAPMYGGGALLIRETVRRTGRGWPTMLVLALAYGVLEEAFTTQTLFNPDYLGLNLHLLSHAFIPALGIGGWWTIYVLTLHTVWSISVPIALTEAVVPDRAATPWLGRIGLTVVSVLFVLMAVSMTRYSIKQDRHHFVASPAQFGVSAAIVVALVAIAFVLPRHTRSLSTSPAPGPWIAGIAAFMAASAFMLIPAAWGWWSVTADLALDAVVVSVVLNWSRHAGWNGLQRLALAGGAALTYAWHAFFQTPVSGGAGVGDRVGNALLAAATIALIAAGARRTANSMPRPDQLG